MTEAEAAAPTRPILLGVDTLCWHLRLERGAVTVTDVLDVAATLRVACVSVNLHHLRSADIAAHHRLAGEARDRGIALLASGDFLGSARKRDNPATGVERVRGWLKRAAALESPYLRLASGFYRTDLAGRPDLIELERRYVVGVLRGSLADSEAAEITLLLENHSDFSADEYVSIVEEVGTDRIGIFLDLINPVAALEDAEVVIRRLAPLALAGHVKDYEFRSRLTDNGYHRRGFDVLYRYPGESVADLPRLLKALRAGLEDRTFYLTIEGLDNRADVDDQEPRLEKSLTVLRRLLVS